MSHLCRDRYHRALPCHYQHPGAVQYCDEHLERGNSWEILRGSKEVCPFSHVCMANSEQFDLRVFPPSQVIEYIMACGSASRAKGPWSHLLQLVFSD